MQSHTPRRATIAASLLALLSAACSTPGSSSGSPSDTPAVSLSGPSAASPSASPSVPTELESVSLRLNFLPTGLHAAWYLGRDLGYFRDEGIDLEIGEGGGSAKTVSLVANGSDMFGLADAGSVMLAAAQGAPVRTVATILGQSSFGVIARADAGIASITDLKGKRVAATAGDALTQLFPAVLSANDLSESDVNLVLVDAAAKVPVVLENQADALLGGIDGQAFALEAEGVATTTLKFSDLGVNTVSIGIVVSEDTLSSNPELVERFIRATAQGWEAAIDDPDAAVEAIAAAVPDTNKNLRLEELMVDLTLLHTEGNEDAPFGFNEPEDWERTLDLMREYRDLETDKVASDFYTNEYLPEEGGDSGAIEWVKRAGRSRDQG